MIAKKKGTKRSPVVWDPKRRQYRVTYWISTRSGLPKSERRKRRFSDTEGEAWQLFDALKAAYGHLEYQATTKNPDTTLQEYTTEWLERVEGDYQQKTFRGYRDNLHLHVLPFLGHLKLKDLTPGDVRRMLESKRKQGFYRGKKHYRFSEDAIRLIRSSLSVVCEDAILDGMISTNPCSGLNRGRRTAPGRSVKKKRTKRIPSF